VPVGLLRRGGVDAGEEVCHHVGAELVDGALVAAGGFGGAGDGVDVVEGGGDFVFG